MADELTRFQTEGPSWGERAHLGELNSVLSPEGSATRNYFLHNIHLVGAKIAALMKPDSNLVVDFGCGTGRFLRFFAKKGFRVIGTEITWEMLVAARGLGLPPRSIFLMTDGIMLPFRDESVDIIWCCAVLRFSLLVPDPAYREIAQELYRILKPGGLVINLEMYVEEPPEIFTRDFEEVGFTTRDVRILQRHRGWMEKFVQRFGKRMGKRFVAVGAKLCAEVRYRFDNAHRPASGLRDYFFVWSKTT